mgnify:CR=1 FL=1
MSAATPTTNPTLEGRPTRVALIGTGYVAAIHAEALRTIPDVELVAVCDVDRAKAEGVRARATGSRTRSARSASWRRRRRPTRRTCWCRCRRTRPWRARRSTPASTSSSRKPMTPTAGEGRELAALARRARAAPRGESQLCAAAVILAFDGRRARRADRRDRARRIGPEQPLRQLSAGTSAIRSSPIPAISSSSRGPTRCRRSARCWGNVGSALVAERAARPPGGRAFFREWQISMRCERGTAQLFMGFGRDFPESWLHVIGQDASIRVDLLQWRLHAPREDPLSRFPGIVDHGAARRERAWKRAASESLWATRWRSYSCGRGAIPFSWESGKVCFASIARSEAAARFRRAPRMGSRSSSGASGSRRRRWRPRRRARAEGDAYRGVHRGAPRRSGRCSGRADSSAGTWSSGSWRAASPCDCW